MPITHLKLSSEEQRALIPAAQAGDEKARAALVRANVGLIYRYAIRRLPHCNTLDLDDLMVEGMSGALRAIDKFDPLNGATFSTYAWQWIREAVGRAVLGDPAAGLSGSEKLRRLGNGGRYRAEREQLHASGKTEEEITQALATKFGVNRASVAAMANFRKPLSLDAPTYDGGDLHDVVAAETVSPEESITAAETREHVLAAVASLTLKWRQRLIVRERLLADDPALLDDLAAVFDISKERVRQLERDVRLQLRTALSGPPRRLTPQAIDSLSWFFEPRTVTRTVTKRRRRVGGELTWRAA